MSKNKRCPHCGSTGPYDVKIKKNPPNEMMTTSYTCTITCKGCTASIRQEGPTREKAEEFAWKMWNMRNEEQPETSMWIPVGTSIPEMNLRHICAICGMFAPDVPDYHNKRTEWMAKYCPNCGRPLANGKEIGE